MKTLNTKLVLSALGIVAMLTSPAFAQKPHRQLSHQQTYSNRQSGVGIYDMVPNAYDPAVNGGGSVGYNQNLHDDAW